MPVARAPYPLPKPVAGFYRAALEALNDEGIPFLVGGAFALAGHAGVGRSTKDLDLFARERDVRAALDVLARRGYSTEYTYPHWLGKARSNDKHIDIIHSSGNGISAVDDEWFVHALDGVVLGVPARLCPVEEMIWSKAFVMERERFDGGDVLHLLRACADRLDWRRLLWRFEPHYRVLLSHLVLFGFVYPGDRGLIPHEVMSKLLERVELEQRLHPPQGRVCQGTLLSRAQFLVDIEEWGYDDVRYDASVRMTDDQISQWTDAIKNERRKQDDD